MVTFKINSFVSSNFTSCWFVNQNITAFCRSSRTKKFEGRVRVRIERTQGWEQRNTIHPVEKIPLRQMSCYTAHQWRSVEQAKWTRHISEQRLAWTTTLTMVPCIKTHIWGSWLLFPVESLHSQAVSNKAAVNSKPIMWHKWTVVWQTLQSPETRMMSRSAQS